MKKIGLISLLIFFIVILYTLLFPVRVLEKDSFKISREFDIRSQLSSEEIDGYYFSDNNRCGYFSSDYGMVSHAESAPGKYLAANIYGYVSFDKVGSELSFFSPLGALYRKVANFGYPYMLENSPYVYVIKTNGAGLSMYHINGSAYYENIQFNSLITSIAVDENRNSLVSTVDGKSYLLTPEGEFESTFENGDSRIKMSKATAIEEGAAHLAIVSGLYPEYLDIYERESGSRLLRLETGSNFNYSSYLNFINNRVYFEGIDNLHYYDFAGSEQGSLEITGTLKEVAHSEEGNLLVLTEKESLNYLYLFTPTGIKLFYAEFEENISNLNFLNEESFYFKLDEKIIKVEQS